MKYLIVNADDFGIASGVNCAIAEAHRRGILTSATIMANMPAFEEAASIAKDLPTLGIGLHFNITQGRPLSDPARVPSLLGPDGNFTGTSTKLAVRYLAGRLSVAEVTLELRAQIEKALDSGIALTHIDSHKHSHALPVIARAIIETVPHYGIRAIRLPDESRFASPAISKQRLTARALSLLCSRIRRHLGPVRTTDHFFGIERTGYWTREWLIDLVSNLPEGTSELMCHPGYADSGLDAIRTRLVASRQTELELLTDPGVRESLQAAGVELVDFRGMMA